MEEIQILISSFKGFSKHTGKSKLTDKLLEIGSYTNGRIIEKIRALVQRKLPSVWQARLKKAGGRKGFLLLIILRLIPAVPYNLINYAFGLTEMPFAAYMLGSAIGIIPGTLVFINIGDKALDVTSPSFWIALGLLVLLLLVVTAFMSKKLFPNNDKDTNGEVTEYGKDK